MYRKDLYIRHKERTIFIFNVVMVHPGDAVVCDSASISDQRGGRLTAYRGMGLKNATPCTSSIW